MLAVFFPVLAAAWLLGIGWGSGLSPLPPAHLALLGIAGIAAAGLTRSAYGRLLGAALLVLLLGATWADTSSRSDGHLREAWRGLAGAPQTFEGTVSDVERRGATRRVRLHDVLANAAPESVLPGKMQAVLSADVDVDERDRVRLTGRIELPEEEPQGAFDAERTFSRHGVFALMRFPKAVIVEEGTPTLLTRLRELLHARIRQALPEPSAGVLSALLLSYDEDLSKELRDTFAASGLIHLIAISGSHVALLATAVFVVLLSVGSSRLVASLVTVIVAACFLVLVDVPPSGVRSVLMAAAVFWAYAAGRRVQGVRALLLAAVLMTAVNPRILLGDLGFQLSALAMWGLVVLYPLLARPFRRWRDLFRLRTMVLLTLAAEIAIAPLLAYTFGRISLIGIFSNIVAIPLFPILLISAVTAATLGGISFLHPAIALFASGSAELFIVLARSAAAIPGAQLSTRTVSRTTLLGVYAFLFFLPWVRSLRRRHFVLRRGVVGV